MYVKKRSLKNKYAKIKRKTWLSIFFILTKYPTGVLGSAADQGERPPMYTRTFANARSCDLQAVSSMVSE